MQAFEHASPTSVEEAVRLLAERKGESMVVAGGTDLLALMKDGVFAPKRLVDVKPIPELRQHGALDQPEHPVIGAAVTLADLLGQPRFVERFPAMVQAMEATTSPQIRAMSTLGGELCAWPRCWYFRKGYGLLAQRGGASMARDGDNRYHAILGNEGPACYVNASTVAVAIATLAKEIRIAGPSGTRRVSADDFFRVPSAEGERPYALADDEIVTGVQFQVLERASATYEVRQRQVHDQPLVSACVAWVGKEGRPAVPRIVLGQVAPVPWVCREAAKVLDGQVPTESVLERVAEAAVAGAKPLSKNAYKVQLAKVAVKRAILRAMGREV